jgi:hypothetical protein
MLVQSHARSFSAQCYSCRREVEINTRTWEIDPKRRIIDYWGACPFCGAEIFEYTSPSQQGEFGAGITSIELMPFKLAVHTDCPSGSARNGAASREGQQ